eukprot:1161047-Pelagomonas_calceolata.AAC.56
MQGQGPTQERPVHAKPAPHNPESPSSKQHRRGADDGCSKQAHLLFQRPTCPLNGEVQVLQQHPATILVGVVEVVHGNGFLALAQGDGRVLAYAHVRGKT